MGTLNNSLTGGVVWDAPYMLNTPPLKEAGHHLRLVGWAIISFNLFRYSQYSKGLRPMSLGCFGIGRSSCCCPDGSQTHINRDMDVLQTPKLGELSHIGLPKLSGL